MTNFDTSLVAYSRVMQLYKLLTQSWILHFMVKLLIIFRIDSDGFFDRAIDFLLEDIFNLNAAATAVAKFWVWHQVEIDVYIHHGKGQLKFRQSGTVK